MAPEQPPLGPLGHRVVVSQFGQDPPSAVEQQLSLEPQPPPEPARLGATDVVIRVLSAAVGWVDLLMTSGQYQHMPAPPYCPGLEYSGEVLWAGDGVDPGCLAPGDRVLADGFLTGPRSSGAYQGYGGFATYAVAPARAVLPLPAALTLDQGCGLLGAYETAYHCLVACGALRPEEVVLVHGASGSIGLAAVHVAKLLGATVIATGRSAAKLEVVREQGADQVLCLADPGGEPSVGSFRREVKALTGGRGVDLVYDPVGGDVSLESLRCVSFGARYLIAGWAATPLVARGRGKRGAPRANQLPTNLIMIKGLRVLGCPTVIATHNDPGIRAERLARIMEWVEQGRLAPLVSASYPLERVKEAMLDKWRSRHVGSAVVNP